jgi:hypothetical protein
MKWLDVIAKYEKEVLMERFSQQERAASVASRS